MTENFREFFVVIAESAGTLIGLLFVAVTVTRSRSVDHNQGIGEFRAAASLLAFTNALVVSLYGLVPGNGYGYPSLIMGIIGVVFAAAGVRTTLEQPAGQPRRWRPLILIVGLLGVFGIEIDEGIRLIHRPADHSALGVVGDVLITSLLIGIGRAWELVGRSDAGFVASVRQLFWHATPTHQK